MLHSNMEEEEEEGEEEKIQIDTVDIGDKLDVLDLDTADMPSGGEVVAAVVGADAKQHTHRDNQKEHRVEDLEGDANTTMARKMGAWEPVRLRLRLGAVLGVLLGTLLVLELEAEPVNFLVGIEEHESYH